MDAITILREDHVDIKEMFDRYAKMPAGQPEPRRELAARILRELLAHERVEDDVFYPTLDATHKLGSLVEDARALDLDDPKFDTNFRALRLAAERHFDQEEEEAFVEARTLGANRLLTLGEEISSRKEEILSEGAAIKKPAREAGRKAGAR